MTELLPPAPMAATEQDFFVHEEMPYLTNKDFEGNGTELDDINRAIQEENIKLENPVISPEVSTETKTNSILQKLAGAFTPFLDKLTPQSEISPPAQPESSAGQETIKLPQLPITEPQVQETTFPPGEPNTYTIKDSNGTVLKMGSWNQGDKNQ